MQGAVSSICHRTSLGFSMNDSKEGLASGLNEILKVLPSSRDIDASTEGHYLLRKGPITYASECSASMENVETCAR